MEAKETTEESMEHEQPPASARVVSALHAPFNVMAEAFVNRGVSPIRMTGSKIPLTLGAIALHQLHPAAGVTAFALASVTDVLDGKMARQSGQTTAEGALLDAFVDKLVNAYMYLYVFLQMTPDLVPLEQALVLLMMLNVALDVISQSLRGNPFRQAVTCAKVIWDPQSATVVEGKTKEMANKAGKIKAWSQFIGVSIALMSADNPVVQTFASTAFAVATVMAGKSIAGRLSSARKA